MYANDRIPPVPDTAPPPRAHLAYLDGLRGVAILLVLMIHTGQLVTGLPGPLRDFTFYGVRGVQLFFIVSGFTLTVNHFGKPLHLANFAARRFFRIAPMFYAGALLYLLLAATTTMPLSTRDASALDIAATFAFLHGWVPSAINTVVPGGWSIAAEAMFYVVFPLLLLVLAPRPHAMAAFVLASYLVAGATSLALRKLVPGAGGQAMALYFWVVQLPAFAGGVWLATLPRDGASRRIAGIALALGVAGLVLDSQLRGRSNLLVAIALLTLVTWAAGIVRPAILEGRVLTLIGQISFSLYIVQFAVLAALHPLATASEQALGAIPAFVLTFALALAISAALSYLTFRWFEQPVIRATRRVGLAA